MLRSAITLVAIAATPIATGAADTGQATAAAPGMAGVKVLGCNRDARDADFQGRMRRVSGADRMSMRFTLFERIPGGQFRPVTAEGLQRWRRSKPLKAVFAYRQRVRGLVNNAAYRTSVQFRWYTEEGETVRRERHRSRICDLSALLPNIRARVIGAQPAADPAMLRYSIRVINRGRMAANAEVRFAVDGVQADTRSVTLMPGQFELIVVQAPRCQRQVEALADPADFLDETDERDNAHTVPCRALTR